MQQSIVITQIQVKKSLIPAPARKTTEKTDLKTSLRKADRLLRILDLSRRFYQDSPDDSRYFLRILLHPMIPREIRLSGHLHKCLQEALERLFPEVVEYEIYRRELITVLKFIYEEDYRNFKEHIEKTEFRPKILFHVFRDKIKQKIAVLE